MKLILLNRLNFTGTEYINVDQILSIKYLNYDDPYYITASLPELEHPTFRDILKGKNFRPRLVYREIEKTRKIKASRLTMCGNYKIEVAETPEEIIALIQKELSI